MKKLIPLLILFSACTKDDINIPAPKPTYTITVDSVLNRAGTNSLPKDANGFYHLKINNPYSNQQSHRVVGKILVNGKEPIPAEKVEWESNLFWILKRQDTIATISKAYINYFTGQFTIVQLPALISQKNELIPTSNFVSYSGKGGEVSNMIAPVREMRGDTLVLKAFHYSSKVTTYTKIVLE
jgi:hypothetical protein